jgi:hypothetical protein
LANLRRMILVHIFTKGVLTWCEDTLNLGIIPIQLKSMLDLDGWHKACKDGRRSPQGAFLLTLVLFWSTSNV